ncbi:hypothetical protein AG1IA_08240 [Rhizoctonia solani AG-1 IA]|uniref:Uncharacterized protein n=1 Tax=Thanatephorus cucumeris (strain AG1-IA) TaxID=983506 RepID=L8WHN2_THACA|nr:hypothetical protein AG1IA_08240 [Rhizoctonia solani AG-1 IA]
MILFIHGFTLRFTTVTTCCLFCVYNHLVLFCNPLCVASLWLVHSHFRLNPLSLPMLFFMILVVISVGRPTVGHRCVFFCFPFFFVSLFLVVVLLICSQFYGGRRWN